MKKLVFAAVSLAALGGASVATAGITGACVGDSFVIEAPQGWVLTYTSPKYAGGWPNMFAEGAAALSAIDGAGQGAVQWEILPNSDLLLAPSTGDMQKDKVSPKYNPVAYMGRLAREGNRITVAVRDANPGLVRFWMSNPYTGESQREELLVDPAQCGASTRLPSTGAHQLCQGSLHINPFDSGVQSTNPASVYVFSGAVSGAEAYAGIKPGRALLRDIRDPSAPAFTTVSGPGENRCPENNIALSPIGDPGREAFALTVCVGEWFVSPVNAASAVAGAYSTGKSAFAEPDFYGTGYGVYGYEPGQSAVFITFDHPDARPTVLRVNVVNCNFNLTTPLLP